VAVASLLFLKKQASPLVAPVIVALICITLFPATALSAILMSEAARDPWPAHSKFPEVVIDGTSLKDTGKECIPMYVVVPAYKPTETKL